MDEFVVDEAGLLSERSTRALAEWYSGLFGKGDVETFEAAIMLLRATNTMTSVPNGPTRNVGRARYGVLRIIYSADQHRMQMGDIGDGLNVSPTNVTKIIDGLVEDGLVRRVRDEQDKRRSWAELTESGIALVDEVLPEMVESTVQTWRLFSQEEKRLLSHLLAKLQMSILMDQATKLSGDLLRSAKVALP